LRYRCVLLSTAFVLSACTQSPVPIVNKGIEGYVSSPTYSSARHYEKSVSKAAPQNVYPQATSRSAPVSAIEEAPVIVEAPPSVNAAELPPVTPPVPETPSQPLYVDDTVPPASQVTEYETNPSHQLRLPAEKKPEAMPKETVTSTKTTTTVVEQPKAVGANFIWPVKGKIISGYGKKPDGSFNDGINIAANQGEPVVAADDGEVVYSGNELQGYGNMVIVRHDDGVMTAYAHADRILVDKGDTVRQGVAIATVGKSGGVEQPQLHFGVRVNKQPVDPVGYLK
jgi:murein DD-endopeptidase MepM/ murein hydrolase activator NlpD